MKTDGWTLGDHITPGLVAFGRHVLETLSKDDGWEDVHALDSGMTLLDGHDGIRLLACPSTHEAAVEFTVWRLSNDGGADKLGKWVARDLKVDLMAAVRSLKTHLPEPVR